MKNKQLTCWTPIPLSLLILIFVEGCSGKKSLVREQSLEKNNLVVASEEKQQTKKQEVPSARATPRATEHNVDNEAELPTVEVVGVNLTTSCVIIESQAEISSELAKIECLLKTNSSQQNKVRISNVIIQGEQSQNISTAVEIAGNAAPQSQINDGTGGSSSKTDEYLLSKDSSLVLFFSVPRKDLSGSALKNINLAVSDLVINDTQVSEVVSIPARVRQSSELSTLKISFEGNDAGARQSPANPGTLTTDTLQSVKNPGTLTTDTQQSTTNFGTGVTKMPVQQDIIIDQTSSY